MEEGSDKGEQRLEDQGQEKEVENATDDDIPEQIEYEDSIELSMSEKQDSENTEVVEDSIEDQTKVYDEGEGYNFAEAQDAGPSEAQDVGQYDGQSQYEGQGQQDDPIMSDDDDSDRLEQIQSEVERTKRNIQDVISDTEISEIPEQSNASDRGNFEAGDEEQEETLLYTHHDEESNGRLGSISDDNEFNISLDQYQDFPITSRSQSREQTLQSALDNSVIGNIFESTPRSQNGRPDNPTPPKYSRYDDLQSKYTRPRHYRPKPDNVTLTYLPSRGVRSYIPFLKSSPLEEFYTGKHVSILIVTAHRPFF